MRRLLFLLVLSGLASACIHPWVGHPVAQLEKEYGSPLSVLKQGDTQVYFYPDDLAGRGQMTFTVDQKGIIRSWCATNDVPSVFGDDPFGIGSTDVGFGQGVNGGLGTNNPNPSNSPNNSPNVGVSGNRAGRTGGRGLAPNCR